MSLFHLQSFLLISFSRLTTSVPLVFFYNISYQMIFSVITIIMAGQPTPENNGLFSPAHNPRVMSAAEG